MQRVGLGAGSRGQSTSRRSASRRSCAAGRRPWASGAGAAERDRIPVEDAWDIPKDSRAWRGQQQLGSLGRRQSLHRAAARRRAPLGDVPHRLARLRPRPGHALLREGAGRSWASTRGQMDLGYFTPRLAVVAVVPERGGRGRQLRDRQPAADRRRRWRARSRRPSAASAEMVYEISHNLVQEETPSRPLPTAGVGPPQGGDARAARRPSRCSRARAGQTTGHPVHHPRLDGRLLVRPAPAARAPRARCTR